MRTRKSSLALVIAAAAAIAITACTSVKTPTASSHITSTAPSASSAARPSDTPSPTPTPKPTVTKPANASQALGPFGYRALYLGMTAKQVRATKLVSNFDDPTADNGCVWAQVKSVPKDSDGAYKGGIVISADRGLVAIYAWGNVTTPQGVNLGDTYATVHAAYPKWSGIEGHSGHGLVAAPGNSAANYRIDVGANGKVLSLALQAVNQDCYE